MSDNITALIAEARENADNQAVEIDTYQRGLLRALSNALEAFVQAPETADHLFENPEPVTVMPEFFEQLSQVTEAPESVQAPLAVDREAYLSWCVEYFGDPEDIPEDYAGQWESLLASGVLQDAAEVEARGLERFANIVDEWDALAYDTATAALENVIEGARAVAQRVREGKNDV